jgi:hypothetical protein
MKLLRVAALLVFLLSQAFALGVVFAAPAPPAPARLPAAVLQPQDAPTLAPTPATVATADPNAAQDPVQETAAIIIIWTVIIITTAITIFLIWYTRPHRHPLKGRSEVATK